MIEVVPLVSSQLDSVFSLCDVVLVHANDIDASIFLAWDKETIRSVNGTFSKDIERYYLDVVRPDKTFSIKLDWLKVGYITSSNSIFDSRNHIDVCAEETEGSNKQEIFTVLELRRCNEASIAEIKLSHRCHLEILLGGGDCC